ncbi:hypothetical protein EVAR_14898_1 [Eumeta japonica]|uniref:Uncharacterized protein n=1 Tax=Eumeta variegata TaxID=151549 RepID=A0A4C2AHT5_EUMVA|nr:hypothetical protein EVAR_14898_1 [Eumeta japonica]
MDKLRKPTIKQKWSTSLRSRHIVDLALSESDQSLRSPGPARIPSPAIPDRSSAQPSPSSSTSSPQFKRPKTVNVPDFNQPKNQAQADSEWGVSTDVEECTSGTKKLLMELGIKPRCAISGFYDSASTHQVITFPDVHVSADEDMLSSSRTFRVSSPTALLDPESGSSYDDSEFSDDDDAKYLVTSAKKEIQQNLSDDEELPPQIAVSLKMRYMPPAAVRSLISRSELRLDRTKTICLFVEILCVARCVYLKYAKKSDGNPVFCMSVGVLKTIVFEYHSVETHT